MNKGFLLGGTLVASLYTFGHAHAADFDLITGSHTMIAMTGEIFPGDENKMMAVLENRVKHHQVTEAIIVNSPGGNVYTALKMASLIERAAIQIGVSSGEQCASACVLLFAAAPHRFVGLTAEIYVHQAGDSSANNSSDTQGAMNASQAMLEAFIRWRVPYSVTRMMVSTPEFSGYLVSPYELANWPETTIVPSG